jgi:SNF2 family DNA or RNA helicase
VGLGKTIEAGIVLSQRWAERKRCILLIVPATLRKQWQQELEEKFYLPSIVLDGLNSTNSETQATAIRSYRMTQSSSALITLLLPSPTASREFPGI